jgi:AcrR family transcriptional regulator
MRVVLSSVTTLPSGSKSTVNHVFEAVKHAPPGDAGGQWWSSLWFTGSVPPVSEQDGSRARGPYAKTAAKRAAIAAAAHAVVLERGHRGLTTAEVAQRAGVSERAMLYHFPSREHLLVAAIETADEATLSATRWLAGTPEEEHLDTLPVVVARDGPERTRVIALFSHLAAAAQDPGHPAREYLLRHNAGSVAALAQLVRRRQELGFAHPDIDAESAARHLLAVWGGLQNQWLVDPAFDLAVELQQAFRRLTGQPTMEARRRLEQALSAP